jgi:hypothetical protein
LASAESLGVTGKSFDAREWINQPQGRFANRPCLKEI